MPLRAYATMAKVNQIKPWSTGYEALMSINIPVVAGMLIPFETPMLAGVAMGTSSIFVLGNSMRLKRLRPWKAPD
jgi:Cu+-exporting ATPase